MVYPVSLHNFSDEYNIPVTIKEDIPEPVLTLRAPATWDGRGDRGEPAASGVYFYKLTTKGFSDTKKTVFLK